MYLSRERKHKKITYEQNLQVGSFNGNFQNQCKDNCS
jgi:hypothetical protein